MVIAYALHVRPRLSGLMTVNFKQRCSGHLRNVAGDFFTYIMYTYYVKFDYHIISVLKIFILSCRG